MTTDKRAIVTGAGSGIGKAVAVALLEEGYAVALAGRRREPLEQTAAESGSAQALVVPTDVSEPESVRALFTTTRDAFGRLDLLFNNAGINVPGVPLDELSLDEWQSVVDINLTGVFLCTQHAFGLMKRQTPRGGRIINNGSISAHVPRPQSAAYTATKAGVVGWSRVLAEELRAGGVRVGVLVPGAVDTPLWDTIPGGPDRTRMLRPEDVARAAVLIASLPPGATLEELTLLPSGGIL